MAWDYEGRVVEAMAAQDAEVARLREEVAGAITLTPDEIDALLWAVRAIPLDRLTQAQAAHRFGEGFGYGALSSATNKLERLARGPEPREETP